MQRCIFVCETCDPEVRQNGVCCKVCLRTGQEEGVRSERDEPAVQAGPRESSLLSWCLREKECSHYHHWNVSLLCSQNTEYTISLGKSVKLKRYLLFHFVVTVSALTMLFWTIFFYHLCTVKGEINMHTGINTVNILHILNIYIIRWI